MTAHITNCRSFSTFWNLTGCRSNSHRVFNFCRYACHVTTVVTQYFYLNNHYNHFALKNILCLPCLYALQISKPLKHLPLNIWSATNTFIWLISVVWSPKLPLMRSKIYPRCGGHLITSSENISITKQDMKNR